MDSATLALFGAGKIGRSFIAQIFARNGYEIVFIDVDRTLIDALNTHGRYRLMTLNNDGSREEHWVEQVRAIDGGDRTACVEMLCRVSLAATSVGANSIPAICATIAAAMRERKRRATENGTTANESPLDIIFAENMPLSVASARQLLIDNGIAPEEQPGLIAASVGKTSPDVPEAERDGDRLLVYGDSYNTLIASANGWRGVAPRFPQLRLVDSIAAYVDRKLFIHNLAHCALAYFGHLTLPNAPYIHHIAEHTPTRARVEVLIDVTAQALAQEYPNEFSIADLRHYARDVFARISNPSLRDSVWRVGRDIPRKLGHNERIVGSMLMVAKHGLTIDNHVQLYAAALSFDARDEHDTVDSADRQFHIDVRKKGVTHALYAVSQFSDTIQYEKNIVQELKRILEH